LPKNRLTRSATGVGRFAKTVAGRGQYGHVEISIHPAPLGSGIVVENEILNGSIPRRFIPAVERGLEKAYDSGEVSDVRIVLEDGSYHEIDSSDFAFEVAAMKAFVDAAEKAGLGGGSWQDDQELGVREPRAGSPAPLSSAVAVPEPDEELGDEN
jgi:elongation factor G